MPDKSLSEEGSPIQRILGALVLIVFGAAMFSYIEDSSLYGDMFGKNELTLGILIGSGIFVAAYPFVLLNQRKARLREEENQKWTNSGK